MNVNEFDAILKTTLEDHVLSRAEKKDLRQRLEATSLRGSQRDVFRSRVFAVASEMFPDPSVQPLIQWLKEVSGVLERSGEAPPPPALDAQVHFSPGHKPRQAICELLRGAQKTVDICVFTITDDRIARVIEDTHRDGVRVRIITDNEKAEDLGSDVARLAQSGIPLKVDRSTFHMHHKFMVTDGAILLTGSYNWTRSAADENEENVLITGDSTLVRPYVEEFESLWGRLA